MEGSGRSGSYFAFLGPEVLGHGTMKPWADSLSRRSPGVLEATRPKAIVGFRGLGFRDLGIWGFGV